MERSRATLIRREKLCPNESTGKDCVRRTERNAQTRYHPHDLRIGGSSDDRRIGSNDRKITGRMRDANDPTNESKELANSRDRFEPARGREIDRSKAVIGAI